MRKAIPVEQRVALTLWYLATNTDYHKIGHLFGVSKATVCMVTKEVCAAIVKVLLPRYIRVPVGDELKKVVEGFKDELGFPQCAGVVDGTHIPIISPEECLVDYFNCKGFTPSSCMEWWTTLEDLWKCTFGGQEEYMNARAFVNSSLYKRGQDGTLFPDWKETVCGRGSIAGVGGARLPSPFLAYESLFQQQ